MLKFIPLFLLFTATSGHALTTASCIVSDDDSTVSVCNEFTTSSFGSSTADAAWLSSIQQGCESGENTRFSATGCTTSGLNCLVTQDNSSGSFVSTLSFYYYGTELTQQQCELLNGVFHTGNISLPTVPTQNVTQVTGDSIYATPVSIDTIATTIASSSSVLTLPNSNFTTIDDTNTLISVQPGTIASFHPQETLYTQSGQRSTLLRGSVNISVPDTVAEYKLLTLVAEIIVANNPQARASQEGTTNFSATYSQSGFDGKLDVSVASGTVEVIGRNGSITTLTAGTEQTFRDVVRRSHWVTPVDGGILQGKKNNILSWLRYPGASGYTIEFNLPVPEFAEDNPKTLEYPRQTITLKPPAYQQLEDLVIWTIPLPEVLQSVFLEARIYPINNKGTIISDSVASDKAVFTYQ